MPTVKELRSVVAAAKALDKARPDWWKKVKVKNLDMSNAANCVLGQVYGDFLYAPEKLQAMRGFIGVWPCGVDASVFNTFWTEEIKQRRLAAKGN